MFHSKVNFFFFCLMLLRITPCALNTLGFGAKKIVIKDEDLSREQLEEEEECVDRELSFSFSLWS